MIGTKNEQLKEARVRLARYETDEEGMMHADD